MGAERPLTLPRETCGVCQFPVEAGEEQTRCAHCGLPFHAECWEQNHGCSAYGCPQVNALAPAGAARTPPTAVAPPPDPFPWDFLLLGAGALSALVGLVAYGVPCALLLAAALANGAFGRRQVGGVFLLCVLVCLVGAVGGAVASYFLWVRSAAGG